ncbi:metal-dependent hydrolase family protein [Pelagibacterium halotolerans]|uniref:Amidohydrolase n=1 Tax=Pelagibacterium halotolerans (strain DSM 22347 / JCM 15775 / CGMCC 1.7692 / B2) TaxID=1082931 RepID=G4RBK1_PELHB|nr:amidohydrolase family protein [Pelagibacterium halotolerans]AEQ53642.1 amidohydrolase [Pelagibacterium halotolerans B2]QJR20186.1 amidohydrolase family protein [Pelagibacterium halotolerans]SEA91067.1 Imidazolonepropionase [Pelagibacterium halotolerans]
MTTSYLFTGGKLLDPREGTLKDGLDVLVTGDRIAEIGPGITLPEGTQTIALDGRTLMPGLIDCHVHVVAETLDLWGNMIAPASLGALRAAWVMTEALSRGFTTLRDLGGADIGLVRGVEDGLIDGPRLVICGKGLTTTGGHADLRQRTDDRPGLFSDRVGSMGLIVDGVDNVRAACRTLIKEGAHFIKVMANGGVSSPNDPIHSIQYSRDEIAAMVEEAENAGLYVSAHLYTDKAIRRCVELGVHSLEHCNLIEPETASMAAEAGCIAVPTLVAYEALAIEGKQLGLGAAEFEKIDVVRNGGLKSLEVMAEAGLPMAFGSDLLGQLRKYHCMEFELLAKVLSPAEIIRSATTIGAKLCRLEGEAGEIVKGASADMIVIDGDPLADISLLGGDGAHMPLIMARGRLHKSALV